MSKSLHEYIQEKKQLFGTLKQTYKNFKVGDHVKVITPSQDFHFFHGDTGIITSINKNSHIGLTVKFDNPRNYEGDWTMYEFNFNPTDLIKKGKFENLFYEPLEG